MPAPDNLQPQTPGQPLTQATEQQATTSTEATEPEYSAKFNGGKRWRVYSRTADDWFSDFVATGDGAKEAAQAEADRLNAGGHPFVKPAEPAPEAAAPAAPAVSATQAAEKPQSRQQAVLTDEGWLCPELPARIKE